MAIEPKLSTIRDMKSLSFAVGLVVAANLSVAAGIHVQPPENTWARLNKSTTLKCKSSDPINTCTWITPTGSIHTLNRGQQAEEGRLKYNSDGEEDECGILIGAVEEKDMGAWTCVLGISLDETEVKSVSGKANVKLATKPSAVRLSTPFESAPFKEVKQDVTCIVNNAQPKPVFTWYVGDELVDYPVTDSETDEGGVKSWVQTMEYSPRKSHANQTLRCVVEHVGLDDVDSKEAVVVLSFTEDFAEAAEVANAEAEAEEDYMGAVPYAVGSVVCLVVVGAMSFFLKNFLKKVNLKEADESEDVEAPVVEGEEKAIVEDECENKDEKVEAKKKTNSMARFLKMKHFRTDRASKKVDEEGEKTAEEAPVVEGEKKAIVDDESENKDEDKEEEEKAEDENKPSTSCMEGLMRRCIQNQEAAEEKIEDQNEGEHKAEEDKETDIKEKQAEEKVVPVESKPSMSCMDGLMGRCLKNQEKAEEKMEDQKEGEDQKEEDKETDNKEKQAEENGVPVDDKTPNEEEDKDEKVEAKKKTKRLAKLRKQFKTCTSKMAEEEEGEKTAEGETGEEKKDEEKPSTDVEYEPEEKDEMNKKQEANSAEEKKEEEEKK